MFKVFASQQIADWQYYEREEKPFGIVLFLRY